MFKRHENMPMKSIPPHTPLLSWGLQEYTYCFLFEYKDCGYWVELPRPGDSNMYPQSMF